VYSYLVTVCHAHTLCGPHQAPYAVATMDCWICSISLWSKFTIGTLCLWRRTGSHAQVIDNSYLFPILWLKVQVTRWVCLSVAKHADYDSTSNILCELLVTWWNTNIHRKLKLTIEQITWLVLVVLWNSSAKKNNWYHMTSVGCTVENKYEEK
jgi:hypothetical protein